MAREKQTTPIATATLNSAELGLSFEDAGGLSGFGAQKQATVRFGSTSMQEGTKMLQALAALGILGSQWRDMSQFTLAMLLAESRTSGATAESPSQSLVAAVDALVGVTEEQFFNSLTEDDHQRLVASLDKLSEVVRKNRNNLCAQLINFIGNIIEKYEEKMDMKVLPVPQNKETSAEAWETLLRLGHRGLEAAYGEDEYDYTAENGETQGAWETLLRLGHRGLEAAYGEDEYDYTAELGGKS